MFKDSLQGVIELGSFDTFSGDKLEFLRDTAHAAAIAIQTVRYQSKRKELLEQTQQQARQLQAQEEELRVANEELAENPKGNLDKEQVESAGVIHNSGRELLQLINEILDLSKIEAGHMILKIEDIDLQDTADALVQSFKHMAAEKGLHFDVVTADGLPSRIQTDYQRLQQILKNLISNALKFTEQGSVTVEIYQPHAGTDLTRSGLNPRQCVAFSVKDTGIGIPDDKQMLVFEAFQQVNGGTTRQYGGTGLGLSIARELTKLLGGEIQLVSRAGRGSSFTLFLPLEHVSMAPAPLAEPSPKDWPRKPALDQTPPAEIPQAFPPPEPIYTLADDRDGIEPDDRCILIIEDDTDFAKILIEHCRTKGFKAIVADSGEAGLMLAEQ